MRDLSSFYRTFLILSVHHTFLILVAALAVPLLASNAARAQQASGQGMLLVTDWPDEATKRSGRFEILPFIDTLSIAYRYRELDDRPDLSIVLEWAAGDETIYQRRRASFAEIEGFPALVGLELEADVVSRGVRVARFSLIVDSMMVEPSPDIIRIDLPDLTWENVFVDTPGDVAREIFTSGFELRNATIFGAGFALFEEGRQVADTAVRKRAGAERRPPHVGPRRPRNVSIYRRPGHIDIAFDLFWLIGSGHRPIRIAHGSPRENVGRGSLGTGRGSRSGRGTADRSRGDRSGRADVGDRDRDEGVERERGAGAEHEGAGRERGEGVERGRGEGVDRENGEEPAGEKGEEAGRDGGRSTSKIPGFGKSKKDDDDDEKEDDNKLVPYAIAAVAAAGVLAAVGGTIGYYGNARYAPFGLTSGFVRDEGGLLLQVGVNEALIAGEGGPKRLMGRVLSFGDLLGSESIQPALGAGVLATSRDGAVEYQPSLSVGGVARHNMLLFYAGYDIMQGSPEFSLALDLRRIGMWGRKSR